MSRFALSMSCLILPMQWWRNGSVQTYTMRIWIYVEQTGDWEGLQVAFVFKPSGHVRARWIPFCWMIQLYQLLQRGGCRNSCSILQVSLQYTNPVKVSWFSCLGYPVLGKYSGETTSSATGSNSHPLGCGNICGNWAVWACGGDELSWNDKDLWTSPGLGIMLANQVFQWF